MKWRAQEYSVILCFVPERDVSAVADNDVNSQRRDANKGTHFCVHNFLVMFRPKKLSEFLLKKDRSLTQLLFDACSKDVYYSDNIFQKLVLPSGPLS